MKNVNSFVLLFIFSFVFQLEVLASKPLVQWAGAAGGANGDESVYVTTVDNKGCFLVAGTSKSSSFSFNNTALSNSNPSYPTSFVAKTIPKASFFGLVEVEQEIRTVLLQWKQILMGIFM